MKDTVIVPACKYVKREIPPFDPVYVTELMNEAGERVKIIALEYPGVWSWAKELRPDMVEKGERCKDEYIKAFASEDLPMCHKWIYYFEYQAKQIIKAYKLAKHLG